MIQAEHLQKPFPLGGIVALQLFEQIRSHLAESRDITRGNLDDPAANLGPTLDEINIEAHWRVSELERRRRSFKVVRGTTGRLRGRLTVSLARAQDQAGLLAFVREEARGEPPDAVS